MFHPLFFYFIKLKKLFLSSPSYSSKTLPYIGMVWKDEYGMQNKFIVCTTSIIGILSIVCSPKKRDVTMCAVNDGTAKEQHMHLRCFIHSPCIFLTPHPLTSHCNQYIHQGLEMVYIEDFGWLCCPNTNKFFHDVRSQIGIQIRVPPAWILIYSGGLKLKDG